MKAVLQVIFKKDLKENIQHLRELKGLGSVNSIFEVKTDSGEYIIRLNDEEKWLEYRKEVWCLEQVAKLNIPSPKVLCYGIYDSKAYMIQQKVPGLNGKLNDQENKPIIWETLGNYAAKFQQIKVIDDKEVKRKAFHKDWKARLHYNLQELHEKDSLLSQKILSKSEHQRAKEFLSSLQSKEFENGLVHGDLCPRNVLIDGQTIYLLDWGTAEINIVPHTEIGILQLSNEASNEELQLFLKGLGISKADYLNMEAEINLLNFLKRLDIYRWAEGRNITHLNNYIGKVRNTFDKLK